MKYIYTSLYLAVVVFFIMLLFFFEEKIITYILEDSIIVILLIIGMTVFTLLKPKISFWLFVASLPIEIVSIRLFSLPVNLRLYQLFGIMLIVSIILNLILKNDSIKKPKIQIVDILFGIVAFIGLSALFIKEMSIRGEIIMISFFSLYIITRIFVRDNQDIIKFIKVFLISAVSVSVYALVQNYLSIHEIYNDSVMYERPNSTFSEADWLGLFLVAALSINYVVVYFFLKRSNCKFYDRNKYLNYFFIFIITSALIITVSRSAWLGGITSTILFFIAVFLKFDFKYFIKIFFTIISIILLAYFFVIYANFTNFSLTNRISSTTSGKQIITIACNEKVYIEEISDMSELLSMNCEHINLEEIEKQKEMGKYVTIVSRPDPNVNIRFEIYKKSWKAIKNNWVTGYGWGSSQKMLGVDGAGTALNTSNIFLEIWISVGIVGVVAFVLAIGILLFSSIRDFLLSDNFLKQTYGLFGFLCLIGILIPNMFNSGIFMGFMWVLLGIIVNLNSGLMIKK